MSVCMCSRCGFTCNHITNQPKLCYSVSFGSSARMLCCRLVDEPPSSSPSGRTAKECSLCRSFAWMLCGCLVPEHPICTSSGRTAKERILCRG